MLVSKKKRKLEIVTREDVKPRRILCIPKESDSDEQRDLRVILAEVNDKIEDMMLDGDNYSLIMQELSQVKRKSDFESIPCEKQVVDLDKLGLVRKKKLN